MLQRPTMKLSRKMSKYFWEAYCLFEILHDENLHLDIISNIDWIGFSTIFANFECFVKRLFLLVLVHFETCRKSAITFEKWWIFLSMVNNMLVKVVAYILLSNVSLYHASRTFKLVNTSSLQEHAFILNNVKALKALFLDSIYKFVVCDINHWQIYQKV